LHLDGAGDVQALSARLTWDARIVTPVGTRGDALLASQSAPAQVLSPAAGVIDAAVFGRGAAFTGSGALARVTFRVIVAGAPAVALASVTARDGHNQPVTLGQATRVEGPARLELASSYPNPFTRATTLVIGMPRAMNVRLGLFDIQGRAVRSLLD